LYGKILLGVQILLCVQIVLCVAVRIRLSGVEPAKAYASVRQSILVDRGK